MCRADADRMPNGCYVGYGAQIKSRLRLQKSLSVGALLNCAERTAPGNGRSSLRKDKREGEYEKQ